LVGAAGEDPIDEIIFLEQLEDMQGRYAEHRDLLGKQVMVLLKPEDRNETHENIR
jgi:hypothetical protein